MPRVKKEPVPADLAAAGLRRCTRCGRAKPPGAFTPIPSRNRLASWCKTCNRIACSKYRRTERYRDWIQARVRSEDVRERRRQADRKRREKRQAAAKSYRATPRARLLHSRRQARIRLARATTGERRAALAALIEAYGLEIARIDRRREKEGG